MKLYSCALVRRRESVEQAKILKSEEKLAWSWR